jgi:hypothetical protein
MGCDMTHEEYKNDPIRLKWNEEHPNDQKLFFEKPDITNDFAFDKNLEVVRFVDYSHYPYNTLSLFYSMHQVSVLTNSYAQEHHITFDYVIRMRSDLQLLQQINMDFVDKNKLYVFEASPHKGEQGKYTIHDQFAIGNPNNMRIYGDLFIYLPCYYFIMKLDWISEIILGYHLQYNQIPIEIIPRFYQLLRYPDRSDTIRPTK